MYEERREESLQIMQETDHKRQKIAEVRFLAFVCGALASVLLGGWICGRWCFTPHDPPPHQPSNAQPQVVAYIDERLAELDEEKEELRAYQQLDKVREYFQIRVCL